MMGMVNLSAPGPKPGLKSCSGVGECEAVFSYPMFRDLERVQTVFSGIAAHRDLEVNLGYRGQTLKGAGMLVSGSYFSVLGQRPALGRLLGSPPFAWTEVRTGVRLSVDAVAGALSGRAPRGRCRAAACWKAPA
jgi:hypothetical protein